MHTNDTRKTERQEKANEIQLNDILRFAGQNWYWFLISALCCLVVAAIYIRTQPRVYTRTASVLIKDEAKGSVSESDAFNDVNLLTMSGNISNEQYIFKSRRLILDVIKRLRLDVTYKFKGRLQTIDLYKSTPLMLYMVGETEMQATSQSFAIVVTPLSDQRIRVQPASSVYEDWQIEASFQDTIDTPYGKLMITPTLSFNNRSFNRPIYITKNNMLAMANAISRGLRVSMPDPKSTIVDIAIADVSIARAEDILNTLINVYNDDANNDKNQIALNTSHFIDERLEIIEAELGSVDANIADYKREHRLTDIHSETGMYLQSTSQYQQQSLALGNQLLIAQSIQDYLRDHTKEKELIPANTGVFDAGLEQQINEYNDMMLQRTKLSSNENDRNPVVINLNNSLNAMRQTIILSVDNLITGLEARIRNTQTQEERTSRRISQVPTQQKYVLSVERQQKIKESLYLYLLNKREETTLSQSIRANKAKLVDAAYGSYTPVSPNMPLILVIASTCGLLIPGLVLWLINALDTKIRRPQDAEWLTSIPCVGEIPYQKMLSESNPVLVSRDSHDPLSEAFRTIRANLLLTPETANSQVILVTSADEKAGKTFVASNLAASFSCAGKKVVFIDFNTELSDYLAGNITNIDTLIISGGECREPDLIRAGSRYSGETLLGDGLNRLLDELRKRYDTIIIDSPSFRHQTDSLLIGRLADLILCVIRYGQTGQRTLIEAEKLVAKGTLHNPHLLLNGGKHKAFHFG